MSNSSLASSTTNTFSENTGLNGNSSTLQCRVQFLDDTDPFSSVNLPEPARPPSFTFLTSTVLSNQLSSVQKVLNAPHKVFLDLSTVCMINLFCFLFIRLRIVHYNYVDKMVVELNLDRILILINHSTNNETRLKISLKGSSGFFSF